MAPEPDIYDVIEADNTAMERVAKSRAAASVANSTPTHSSNHSIIGRGILKRGKSSRRPGGSDSGRTRAGFSDVKSVSRCVCVCVFFCRAIFCEAAGVRKKSPVLSFSKNIPLFFFNEGQENASRKLGNADLARESCGLDPAGGVGAVGSFLPSMIQRTNRSDFRGPLTYGAPTKLLEHVPHDSKAGLVLECVPLPRLGRPM